VALVRRPPEVLGGRRWVAVIAHPVRKGRRIHELALRSRLPPIVERESRSAAPVLSVSAALLGRPPGI
jgi:hypothetical protein